VSVVQARRSTANSKAAGAAFIHRGRSSAMRLQRGSLWITGVAALFLLQGCATSRVPEAIREAPQPSPSVSAVQQQPDVHLGQRVRWGGKILAVHNARTTTEIEILAAPLGSDGKPQEGESGLGRFIVELAGFKDPAEFPEERRLTVVGALTGVVTRNVGDYPYRYPVVAGDVWYLWPNPPPDRYASRFYDPWYRPWYGPWYGPRYGPGFGPWYGPWY
jgi:outer membrane lipoprotein